MRSTSHRGAGVGSGARSGPQDSPGSYSLGSPVQTIFNFPTRPLLGRVRGWPELLRLWPHRCGGNDCLRSWLPCSWVTHPRRARAGIQYESISDTVCNTVPCRPQRMRASTATVSVFLFLSTTRPCLMRSGGTPFVPPPPVSPRASYAAVLRGETLGTLAVSVMRRPRRVGGGARHHHPNRRCVWSRHRLPDFTNRPLVRDPGEDPTCHGGSPSVLSHGSSPRRPAGREWGSRNRNGPSAGAAGGSRRVPPAIGTETFVYRSIAQLEAASDAMAGTGAEV